MRTFREEKAKTKNERIKTDIRNFLILQSFLLDGINIRIIVLLQKGTKALRKKRAKNIIENFSTIFVHYLVHDRKRNER